MGLFVIDFHITLALFGYQELVFLWECRVLFRLMSVFLRDTQMIRSGRLKSFPEYSCTKSNPFLETSYTDTFLETS